jgi:hypothetical protein
VAHHRIAAPVGGRDAAEQQRQAARGALLAHPDAARPFRRPQSVAATAGERMGMRAEGARCAECMAPQEVGAGESGSAADSSALCDVDFAGKCRERAVLPIFMERRLPGPIRLLDRRAVIAPLCGL